MQCGYLRNLVQCGTNLAVCFKLLNMATFLYYCAQLFQNVLRCSIFLIWLCKYIITVVNTIVLNLFQIRFRKNDECGFYVPIYGKMLNMAPILLFLGRSMFIKYSYYSNALSVY